MPKLPDDKPPAPPTPLGCIIRRLDATQTDFDPQQYNQGTGFDFSTQTMLLSLALQAAVPLWFLEVREREDRMPPEQFERWVRATSENCANLLAEKGDLLMFRGKRRGQTAAVFNALAQGVALMALCPGGVTLFGTHWEYKVERVAAGRGPRRG